MVDKPIPVGAVVLAAGTARRMGSSKLDLDWPIGGSILGRVLDILTEGGVEHVVVVTGGHRDQVESIAAGRGIPATFNPEFDSGGMITSISTGLGFLDETPAAGALIMPADHPLIKPETISAIIAAWRDRTERIWVPSHARRRGHPVLVPRELWGALASEDGELGLRSFLDRHEGRVSHLNVADPGIRMDIDDQDAYQRLADGLEG